MSVKLIYESSVISSSHANSMMEFLQLKFYLLLSMQLDDDDDDLTDLTTQYVHDERHLTDLTTQQYVHDERLLTDLTTQYVHDDELHLDDLPACVAVRGQVDQLTTTNKYINS